MIVADLKTGELLIVDDLQLNDTQARIIRAYREWHHAELLAITHGLEIPAVQARRQQQYCERDFLWTSAGLKQLLKIQT